jgi:hypothetical protein
MFTKKKEAEAPPMWVYSSLLWESELRNRPVRAMREATLVGLTIAAGAGLIGLIAFAVMR